MSADTFESLARGLARLGSHASSREASRALPEGVYTTFRTYERDKVLRLGQHVGRLVESASLTGANAPLALPHVRNAVREALAATRHAESRVRLTFAPPRLFVTVEPFTPLPAKAYEDGVTCVTVPVRRENPHAKDTRFVATASDAYARLPPGVEEGLMVSEEGTVLEGLSSNFFAVRDGRLWTEEARVLAGVTRSLVLQVASGVLPVSRTGVALDARVEECFITSVSREVLPVVRVDDGAVGTGRPGPATRAIADRFADLVRREAERV
jgi:branched-subunit amino acid aminotransferase/4-amino-4-deoxychorismate lyase